jgi:excinuclease ABC subunit B
MPVSERVIYRVELLAGKISKIEKIDAITRAIVDEPKTLFLFPAKHFLTPEDERKRAIAAIKEELDARLKVLKKEGKPLEAERLRRRTTYDLAMIKEVGYCNGIENYSRHLSGHKEGEPPDTLLSYFPHTKDGKPDFLTIVDESHVTIPQIGGMYAGDASRKKSLVEFGFRLPSALDNRPLRFNEFQERVGQVIYTSATPGTYELEKSGTHVAEQIIRLTGLVDPELDIRPIVSKGAFKGQVKDFIDEAEATIKKGYRVLATTLTKKMAEDLSLYLRDQKLRAEYLHSEIKTIDRIRILTEFRKGDFDCLVGVNLLREGLDLPEVALIGILDADKEGFLRSETSLIQTIGRAARNAIGRVILYADQMTGSMDRAIKETNRRREIQMAYNKEHGITPQTIRKKIHDITEQFEKAHDKAVRANLESDASIFKKNPERLIKVKEKQMNGAAKILDFETAAILRDEIRILKESLAKGNVKSDAERKDKKVGKKK